jgi:hypothetical protein
MDWSKSGQCGKMSSMAPWARKLIWLLTRAFLFSGLAAFFLFFLGTTFLQRWMVVASVWAFLFASACLILPGVVLLASNLTARDRHE